MIYKLVSVFSNTECSSEDVGLEGNNYMKTGMFSHLELVLHYGSRYGISKHCRKTREYNRDMKWCISVFQGEQDGGPGVTHLNRGPNILHIIYKK